MFPLDQNLNSFVPLYTAPASKKTSEEEGEIVKKGQRGKQEEKISTQTVSAQNPTLLETFSSVRLTSKVSFTIVNFCRGTAQNQTKQIGLQTIKRMFFLSSFSVSTENCFHAESGRRNRSVAETRKYKIKILLCFVLPVTF